MTKSTSRQPRFSAYIPPDLFELLRMEALKNRRSMNNQLVWCLEQVLRREHDDVEAGPIVERFDTKEVS